MVSNYKETIVNHYNYQRVDIHTFINSQRITTNKFKIIECTNGYNSKFFIEKLDCYKKFWNNDVVEEWSLIRDGRLEDGIATWGSYEDALAEIQQAMPYRQIRVTNIEGI